MILLAMLLCSVLLAAGPVSALDLTGTWEGKFVCSEFDGAPAKFPEPGQTFKITQTGSEVSLQWVEAAATYTGVAIPDAQDPEGKGEVALADCTTSADLAADYGELLRGAAKVNREKGKGTLKGLTIYVPTGPVVGSCKAKFKLVDTADPAVGGCPL